MNRFVSSKHLESVSDLTLSAPVKPGFIDAFEAVTYETRLRKVLEALFKIRATAREHSRIKPFVETAERIQSLLDFRLAIVDSRPPRLLLSATFDRPFEPYMRLIWDPLGPLLDLIFCNCEGYVTATDHSFEEYLAWVRSAQIDTDFFYTMSGHSVSDLKYLLKIERLDRQRPGRSSTLVFVENPEVEALRVRNRHKADSDFLGLQALVGLYRLTEFYPPDEPNGDGRFLRHASQQLLQGWGEKGQLPSRWERELIPEQLRWFREGLETAEVEKPEEAKVVDKEREREKVRLHRRLKFDLKAIQGGILDGYEIDRPTYKPVRHGALLLMRILDPTKAQSFIKDLPVRNGERKTTPGDKVPEAEQDIFLNIAFTRRGLETIGVSEADLARFPREFHEGMEERAGLLGDLRESHPRNWIRPERNFPLLDPATGDPLDAAGARSATAPSAGGGVPVPPRIELSEVDIVVQLRTIKAHPSGKVDEDIVGDAHHPLHKHLWEVARQGAKSGVRLLGVQAMRRADTDDKRQNGRDYFGFQDGFSQPIPVDDPPERSEDQVARGELLWGYSNDRSDPPPPPNEILDNGTFLVVRKLRQDVAGLKEFVEKQARQHNIDKEMIYGKMMGRTRDGVPMVTYPTMIDNRFGYMKDQHGVACPFQAHIRRANPRSPREGMTRRPNPRILRRGLSYGPPPPATGTDKAERGVMFMAYNASIAEQYEVIQRWVNGGNSTGVGSWQSDPLMGLHEDESEHKYDPSAIQGENPQAKYEPGRTFRFRHREGSKFRTVRLKIPKSFVSLQWGMYLFVPSMKALKAIAERPRNPERIRQSLEAREAAKGRKIIARLRRQAEQGPEGRRAAAAAWKTYIEDFSSKDPAERADSPAIWAAIRADHAGALRVPYGIVPEDAVPPDIILVGSKELVMEVFRDRRDQYSMRGQMARMRQSFGEIYLGMDKGQAYWDKSTDTNRAILDIDEPAAFAVAYGAAQRRLGATFDVFEEVFEKLYGEKRREGELELRRDFLTPILGSICNRWFGIPDSFATDPGDLLGLGENGDPPAPPPPAVDECAPPHVYRGGWNWRTDRKPRCPGDYMATSRYCFYPDPVPRVQAYGREQGQALRKAVRAHFEQLAREKRGPLAPLSAAISAKFADKDELARTVIGVMTGFLPPADGCLRWTLYEWLEEKLLWRAQHDLLSCDVTKDLPDEKDPVILAYHRADRALRPWLEQAMQKRPSPDLLWRTATRDHRLGSAEVRTDEKVVIGIVSALAEDAAAGVTDVYPIFGGNREGQDSPLHACPAFKAAMGTMLGILTALLDRCRIEALPAPLFVRVTDLQPKA